MKAVVFDIDGTLTNLNHRLHYIKNKSKNYDAFFDAMVDDAPNNPIVQLAQLIDATGHPIKIIVCSGRPDSHRPQTLEWLDYYVGCIDHDALYMRKTGDYRPDHIIKKEMLQQMRTDGYDPFLVVDDRPSVVKMWRDEGLTCLQCADWEESI